MRRLGNAATTRWAALVIIATAYAPGAAVADGVVEFENDLIPVFTRHGCNAGACHGAAIGRGGFKLSLYGGDPRADHEAIVRQLEGRRINLARPDESLLVLKPTEYLDHGGGGVLESDGAAARLLVRWIAEGGRFVSTRELKSLEIAVDQPAATEIDQPMPWRAIARYADGSSRDVTDWTVLAAEDDSAVEVDSTAATIRLLRRGRHLVVARYLTEVVPVELLAPLSDDEVDLSTESRRNFVDEEVLGALEMLRLPASPLADDATFLRRVTLDLTGRLPTPRGVVAFLSNDSVDKRGAVIDELLRSEEFAEYWTLQLAKLLRIRPQGDDARGASTYHAWLSAQIRDDASYRDVVRSLLLATGDSHEHGPANFYRTTPDPREQAEFVSELLMGSRLRCANCHNHPLDRWTQDDYHGLAAIFAKVESGRVVQTSPSGEVIHPRTLEPAPSKLPGERFLDRAADGREEFADWLTDAENQYFAKAIVNRLWNHMFGRGLVEPVDDFRSTNPATHPVLLDRLAENFETGGYRLRPTLGLIARSASYQRSADALPENREDDRFYSHARHRPLEPEVLADAVTDVLQVPEQYGEEPLGTRAVALVDPNTPSRTLDVLGRCVRDESCEASPGAAGGLPQKLHLFNGALLNARIAAKDGRLERLLAEGNEPPAIVESFYLAALGRRPSGREQEHWNGALSKADSLEERRAYLEDFVWGLLTCQEFATNH